MSIYLHLSIQERTILFLYYEVNGPIYATVAEERTIFPIKFLKSYCNIPTLTFHL